MSGMRPATLLDSFNAAVHEVAATTTMNMDVDEAGANPPTLASIVLAFLGMRFLDCPTYAILPSRQTTTASSTVRSGKMAVPPVKQSVGNVLFFRVDKATLFESCDRERYHSLFAVNNTNLQSVRSNTLGDPCSHRNVLSGLIGL